MSTLSVPVNFAPASDAPAMEVAPVHPASPQTIADGDATPKDAPGAPERASRPASPADAEPTPEQAAYAAAAYLAISAAAPPPKGGKGAPGSRKRKNYERTADDGPEDGDNAALMIKFFKYDAAKDVYKKAQDHFKKMQASTDGGRKTTGAFLKEPWNDLQRIKNQINKEFDTKRGKQAEADAEREERQRHADAQKAAKKARNAEEAQRKHAEARERREAKAAERAAKDAEREAKGPVDLAALEAEAKRLLLGTARDMVNKLRDTNEENYEARVKAQFDLLWKEHLDSK